MQVEGNLHSMISNMQNVAMVELFISLISYINLIHMGQSFITVTSSYWECIYTYAEAVGQDAIVGKSNMKNQDAPPNVSIEFLFLLTIADTFYYFEVGFEITILLIALYLISLSNISSMLKMVVKYHTCICNGIAVASQTSGSRRWSQG